MPVVAYLRHGDKVATRETVFRDGTPGTIPAPLSDAGIRQASLAGRALSPFEIRVLGSSPVLRAYQTAVGVQYELSAAASFNKGIILSDFIRERAFGRFNNGCTPEGMAWVQLRAEQAAEGYPDLEHPDRINRRVEAYLQASVPYALGLRGIHVAVTHQCIINAATSKVLGVNELDERFDPGVPPGSVTVISYTFNPDKEANPARVIEGELVAYGVVPNANGRFPRPGITKIREAIRADLALAARK